MTVARSQTSGIVSSPIELMGFLQENQHLQFSYPTDVEKMMGPTSNIQFPLSESELKLAFSKYACDITFLNENHILLRPKLQNQSNDLVEIKIIDSKTKDALEWVALSTPEKNEVYFTNSDGQAFIKNNGRLELSLLGYAPMNIEIPYGQKKLSLALVPAPVQLIQVKKEAKTITANSDRNGNTIINFTQPYSFQTIGPGGKDVYGAVQMLPGIDGSSEEYGKIKVRGSNADETLVLLDGIPVIQNSHYYDIFGTINPLFIDQFKIYKNQYPVEYSGRTGGLVSFTSHKPEKAGEIDVNFFTTSANVSIPLGKGFTIGGAMRSTYRNISNNNFYSINKFNFKNFYENLSTQGALDNTVTSSPNFGFSDSNLKFRFENEKTAIQLSYVGISDKFENKIDFDVPSRGPNPSEKVIHKFSNTREWHSLSLGATLDHKISQKSTLHTTIFNSRFTDDYVFNVLLSGGIQDLRRIDNSNVFSSDINRQGLMAYLDLQMSERMKVKIGYDLEHVDNNNKIQNERKQNFLSHNNGYIQSLFFNTSIQPENTKWNFNVGVRTSKSSEESKIYPSLQFASTYKISSNFDLKSAISKNYQLYRQIEVRDIFDQGLALWTISGGQVPALSSTNLTAGFIAKKGLFMLDFELYYKKLNGVAEYANPQPGIRLNPEVNERLKLFSGTGISQGMDLLTRYEIGHYNMQIAYSWSKLVYKIPGVLQGKAYYAPSDRRHQLKWINSYNIGNLTFNTNFHLATGQPFLNGQLLDENSALGALNGANTLQRLPNYMRSDCGISYGFQIGSTKSTISANIYNITNRQNIKQIHYLSEIKNTRTNNDAIIVGTVTNMLNRTINLAWSLVF